jgi:hypothetical protein
VRSPSRWAPSRRFQDAWQTAHLTVNPPFSSGRRIARPRINTPAGTFSGYFRSDKLNAADPIAQRVIPYSDQQLSGTFGGPIRKDRIHYFGSYDYERESSCR